MKVLMIFWIENGYYRNRDSGINSLKYPTSTTLGYQDIGIRKPEVVAKTHFL